MKKNLFFLFALICSVSLFTACSDDDDNKGGDENLISGPMVGTWQLAEPRYESSSIEGEIIKEGAVKLTWEAPAGVTLTVMGIPMPLPTIAQLAERFTNPMIYDVLKDITLGADGNILATYGEKNEATGQIEWKESEVGYATWQKVDDSKILVFLNLEKIMGSMTKADQNALTELLQLVKNGIPVNVRYDEQQNPYFFIDKALVVKIAPLAAQLADLIPDSALDGMAGMLKGILKELPNVMEKTTKFEAGLQMKK